MKMRRLFLISVLFLLTNISLAAEDLLDIYALAVAANPDLKQAQLAYELSLESKRQDISLLLPSVNISGNTKKNKQKRTYDISQFDGEESYRSYGYSLTVKQSIFNYDNLVNLKQATDRVNQANTELQAAEQTLIINLLERYFEVLAAQDNIRFNIAEKQAVERQMAQAETRLNAGLATITDVYEAKAQLDATVAQEIDALYMLENSLESLREISNKRHDKLRPLVESFDLIKPVLSGVKNWVDVAVKNNLDIVSLRQNNSALRKEINRQRSGHYPTLDLVASYSKTTSGGGNFGQSDTESRTIGLQLNLPIYQGGAVSSRIKISIIRYQQNLKKINSSIRSIRSQVSKAYFGVLASIARVNSLKQLVESNGKALTAIEAGNRVGMRTVVDILLANRKLYKAQRDYERARYDYILNGLRLKQLAGNLSLEDLQQTNLRLN